MAGAKFVTRFCCALAAMVLLSGGLAYAQSGVVVIRTRPGQADEFTSAMTFTQMGNYGVVTHFTTGPGSPTIVENATIAGLFLTGDLPGNELVGDEAVSGLKKRQVELTEAARRFPSARAFLNPVLTDLQESIRRLSAGEVRHESKWMSAQEYQALKAKGREMADLGKKRETNLTSKQSNLAAKWLLSSHRSYLAELELHHRKPQSTTGIGEGSSATDATAKGSESLPSLPFLLPTSIVQGGVLLPQYRDAEVALKVGQTDSAPAMVHVTSGEKCVSCRLAFTVTRNGDVVQNKEEIRAAASLIGQMDYAISSWLLLAITSAQTRFELNKATGTSSEVVSIQREISGVNCELIMNAETSNDTGQLCAVYCLTLR